jgi:hypothetical protein
MTKENKSQNRKPMEINEYHKLEIEEIFARTRELINIRIQAATFLGTVNLALLSIAFNEQKTGLIFAAASALILLIIVDRMTIRRSINTLIFRGMQLENKYAPDAEEALLHLYAAVTTSHRKNYAQMVAALKLQEQEKRISTLRTYRWSSLPGLWLPLGISLIEMTIALILNFSGWQLF